MRGEYCLVYCLVLSRITPTCVGNTTCKTSKTRSSRDHPHLRGEYDMQDKQDKIKQGSPPLAWGILQHVLRQVITCGITPTCVGNTLLNNSWFATVEDHPHLRGEYTRGFKPTCKKSGSPPLAWGILEAKLEKNKEDGITPTCVGNTSLPASSQRLRRDHPHLRGEYFKESQSD